MATYYFTMRLEMPLDQAAENASMQAVENEQLGAIAGEVRKRLQKVVDSL